VQWHLEPGYDRGYVETVRHSGYGWSTWDNHTPGNLYDGAGGASECIVIDVPDDSTQIRFRVYSDNAYSDEDGNFPSDGAMLLDSIRVECYNGGVLTDVFYEDFEDEATGATVTNDGFWTADVKPSHGDFAQLYPGITVLQEDRCMLRADHVWGFFDDLAISNYACGGFPAEPAVRRSGGSPCTTIRNEIWSPLIEVTGSGSEFNLSFQVYRDMILDALVFYRWKVRSWTDGCPGPWDSDGYVYYGNQKDWFRANFSMGPYIEPGATHIQVAIGVFDYCDIWCIFGCGDGEQGCVSHAPLFDDVHVTRVNVVGPQFDVKHVNLFQDNFAEDGTLTGHARADMAQDLAPSWSPTILPGDSVAFTVADPSVGIKTDPNTGVGPAVYAYVAVWPQGQAGKTGADLEAPETRAGIGKRYPFVGNLIHDGVTWHCFRADTVYDDAGDLVPDRYCIDLNDAVFTPGDTVCYFFCAENNNGERNYWSRGIDGAVYDGWWKSLKGQGEGFVTSDISEVMESPCEFTILPAGGWKRGGDILYVDDADDRLVQLYFDWFFDMHGILNKIDRYDVLGPSSAVGNSLASRVRNQIAQIRDCYRKIIWCSGDLSPGTIGDGTGQPEKSDDYGLLYSFLNTHPDNPGLYLSGDDIAEEWVGLAGSAAIGLRSQYISFNLDNGDHVAAGEPVSPLLTAVSPNFTHLGVPDEFIAFGGCPAVNDFDLLTPTGTAVAELNNLATGKTYVISQATPNAASSTARVMLSGFSYHYIADTSVKWPPAYWEHLRDIILYLRNIVPIPSAIPDDPQVFAYRLDANYPNPFNPVTTIRYSIAQPSHVTLRIYNIAGQLVRTLVNEEQTPRPEGFAMEWDGASDKGSKVASGVYLYRLVAGEFDETRKMVLLK
jgi:hypothetical protein